MRLYRELDVQTLKKVVLTPDFLLAVPKIEVRELIREVDSSRSETEASRHGLHNIGLAAGDRVETIVAECVGQHRHSPAVDLSDRDRDSTDPAAIATKHAP